MKYSPECVAAFEAFAASNRWDIDKDEGGYYIDWSMAAALAAFAANWERVRELEEACALYRNAGQRVFSALSWVTPDNMSPPIARQHDKALRFYRHATAEARKLLEKGDDTA